MRTEASSAVLAGPAALLALVRDGGRRPARARAGSRALELRDGGSELTLEAIELTPAA